MKLVAFVVVLMLGMTLNAQADAVVSPAVAVASGNQTSNSEILAAAAAFCGCTLTSRYKDNVNGAEEGGFASSYITTYTPNETDASGFTIDYVSGPAITGFPTVWLIVKDGNNQPAWYLFNLTALGYDGTEDIVGSGFWPTGTGAISHVEILTSGDQKLVPEPSSLLLLGYGLLAAGVLRRKMRS